MKSKIALVLCLILLGKFFLFCKIGKSENIAEKAPPILVLIEEPGSSSNVIPTNPQFVLYNDGSMIYSKGKNEYQFAKISRDAFKELLPRDSFKSLKEYYSVTSTTDLGLISIKYWEDGVLYPVSIYGDLQSEEDRKRTPKDFLYIYDEILKQSKNEGNRWTPNHIEIHFFGTVSSRKNLIRWPADIPIVAKNRSDGTEGMYVEGKHCADFMEFTHKLNKEQAISFYGNALYLRYRYIFPFEEIWIK